MGVYVGIDVSKQHLDWVLGEEGNVERASNSPAGVRQLVARLSKIEIASVIVESTGGYERAARSKRPAAHEVGVDHGRLEAAVAEQRLNGADVGAVFE